jgi:ABC-type nitrate/sulfonate/bicarbonate transport system ATPase subunit
VKFLATIAASGAALRRQPEGLGKRYGKRWALAGCTLPIPAGHVVSLVGPNGAGKTTLIELATGMLAPSAGTIEVLGGRPVAGPAQLARVGYLAQDAPLYAGLPVAHHPRLGAHLNPGWDAELARRPIERLSLDPKHKAGTLSGGQRAQLALTLAAAKRPELLILDEPVASLDPLARREFLQDLMEAVAEQRPREPASVSAPTPGWRSPPASCPASPGAWIMSSEGINAAGEPVSTIPRPAWHGRRRCLPCDVRVAS